jgi:hypothetical protein
LSASGQAGVEFACSIDGEPFEPCAASIELDGLAPGPHTLTVVASSAAGEGEPVTIHVEVDGESPAFEVAGAAGAENTGAASIAIALERDEEVAVEAGVELMTSAGATALVADSCSCSGLACACDGLAAGTSRIAVRVSDVCGNAAGAVEDVTARYGPHRGHAVLIGHDYSDADTPAVVGNAAAQIPFVAGDLSIGRTAVRVVAWRPAGVAGATATRVVDAVEDALESAGATFDRTSELDYLELADPDEVIDAVRGRDLLILHEPAAAHDDLELDSIADDWAADLAAFAEAGGVVIALDGDHGWRLLAGGDDPLIDITAGAALTPVGGQDYTMHRYPPAVLGTESGYALLAGIDDDYATPGGSGCVELSDPAATVVAEHVTVDCGDGCTWTACDGIVDQLLPRYQIDVAPAFDPDPYPTCVPDGVGLDSVGTFTVSSESEPPPGGTFACTYLPAAGYLQSPDPAACTVTSQEDGTYSISFGSPPRLGTTSVDITLLAGGRPVRSGRATIVVDGDLFVAAFPVAADSCGASYVVHEFRPPVDAQCDPQIPTWLAVESIGCTLERETGPGTWSLVATHAGTDCGAAPSAGGGFESADAYTVDWSADITGAGAAGTLRSTVSSTDFHGNSESSSRTWDLSGAGICGG